MKYHRSASEEEQFRFRLFIHNCEDVAQLLDKGNSRIPIFRSPTTVLDHIEDELESALPFWTSSRFHLVINELQWLAGSDPALGTGIKLQQDFLKLAATLTVIMGKKKPQRTALIRADVPPLLSAARAEISNGAYFGALTKAIAYAVCDAPIHSITSDTLRTQAKALVFAFLASGFSAGAIKSLCSDMLETFREIDGFVYTVLPIELEKRHYLKGPMFDRTAYNNDLKAKIGSLTIRDRIMLFGVKYSAAPQDYTIVSPVIGAYGMIDQTINGVNFMSELSAHQRLYYCRADIPSNEPEVIIAATTVIAHDQDAARTMAAERASLALDVIAHTLQTRSPLSIDVHRMSTADSAGHHMGGSYGAAETHRMFWLNFNHIYPVGFQNLLDNGALISNIKDQRYQNQLRASIHAFRRSRDSLLAEDKLLNAWVALEAILGDNGAVSPAAFPGNAEGRVRAVCRMLAIDDHRFGVAIDAHHKIQNAVSNQTFNGHTEDVMATNALLHKDGFIGGFSGPTSLVDVAKAVSNVRPFIHKPLLRAAVEHAVRFYDDPRFALNELETIDADVDNEIIVIYKLRNRFVHEGKRYRELLEYYASRATAYAGMLIWYCMQGIRTASISNDLKATKARIDALFADLRSGSNASLLT